MLTDWEIRRQMVAIGKKMYQQRLVSAKDGNISVKMKKDKIIITPGSSCLGTLDFNHMVHINSEGVCTGELRPSSEMPMHLEIYRQRPDVNAIIHAHPIITTAFTLTGEDFSIPALPEVVLMFGEIPIAPYATPATDEGAKSISELILKHNVIVLDHHGSLTVGKDLTEAYCRLEKLEHTANILFAARQLGKIKPLSDSDIEKLMQLKKEMNYGA